MYPLKRGNDEHREANKLNPRQTTSQEFQICPKSSRIPQSHMQKKVWYNIPQQAWKSIEILRGNKLDIAHPITINLRNPTIIQVRDANGKKTEKANYVLQMHFLHLITFYFGQF